MITQVSKEHLIELIEAYAVAQKSQNTTLITMAVGAVKNAIDALYAPEDDFSDAETKPAAKATRRSG